MPRTHGSGRARRFFDTYTRDLKREDVERMFTRDTREAYRFFAREIDRDALGKLPWLKRQWVHAGQFARAFLMRLSPARRVLYGVALGCAIVGMLELFNGFSTARMPLGPVFSLVMVTPVWVDGTMWLFWSLVATNLLVLLEVPIGCRPRTTLRAGARSRTRCCRPAPTRPRASSPAASRVPPTRSAAISSTSCRRRAARSS